MTPNEHLELFDSFSELELSTGGPDPQVALVARACRDLSPELAAWRAGCFVGPYTCGGGAAIWRVWDPDVAVENQKALTDWLRQHWEGIPIRRERRSVWKPEKLAECLASYARWSERVTNVRDASYDDLYWSVLDNVKFFGRYATMKLLEVLHLAGVTSAAQTDIRPQGAWSPRKTLDMLYPPHQYRGDKPSLLEEATDLACQARQITGATWFQTETLLCNYRQALAGKYPGRSHDRELGHFRRAEKYWGEDLLQALPFYQLRQELFPHVCLGEIGDWNGARKELEQTFGRSGYFWCDTIYDYHRTIDLDDLAHPRRWST